MFCSSFMQCISKTGWHSVKISERSQDWMYFGLRRIRGCLSGLSGQVEWRVLRVIRPNKAGVTACHARTTSVLYGHGTKITSPVFLSEIQFPDELRFYSNPTPRSPGHVEYDEAAAILLRKHVLCTSPRVHAVGVDIEGSRECSDAARAGAGGLTRRPTTAAAMMGAAGVSGRARHGRPRLFRGDGPTRVAARPETVLVGCCVTHMCARRLARSWHANPSHTVQVVAEGN
ncbi:hypothetical protein GGX14DRAFT_397510 [Mycena pura]|uniref:Uncharacterized protein n=1 Tax=Mycena pura TaxID=153505 RepID=A0AAD6V8X0_9AGAR|nr:hypothetical protein GGX14DRAFT_397510 [Mycena pura]